MAGVIDGTPVDAANTNPKFIYKDSDDSSSGILQLNNAATASGSFVTSLQREHNSIASFAGKSLNSAKDDLPSYTNNQGFTSSNSLKDRADEISAKFHSVTGHNHSGSGQGSPIPSSAISGTPLQGYLIQGTTLTGASGASTDISTEMSGKIASTGSTVEGVVVDSPYNKIALRNSSNDKILDSSGNDVYGRVTYAASIWTLTYYVDIAGTETPYTISSPIDIKWYFQQLYNPLNNPPVYNTQLFIPSENATADVLDASATQRGVVSTGTQSFAGNKTFSGAVTATLSGSTIDASLNTLSNISDTEIKSGANINADKIGTGIVSNTEFNYLDGVTSAIQTQLNGKEPTITTLDVARGGTGQTSYTDGQLLIGNSTGNTLAKSTLTAGTNITITNGPGSITIAASGTSVDTTARLMALLF